MNKLFDIRFVLIAVIFGAMLFTGAPATSQILHDLHEKAEVPCSACHQDSSFEIVPPQSTCVACHGTMLELEPGVEPVFPDPHRSPHLGADEIPDCMSCHKIHSPSIETCTVCHRSFKFELK